MGGHQYPLRSFLPPYEEENEMRKLLLNLVSGEPLSLVKELACFENLIYLDLLLAGVLDLFVHNPISCGLSHAVGV